MSDTYLGVVYCCTHCRLRKSECACTDETPWARNRATLAVDRAEYGQPWSSWGPPQP